MFFGWLEKIIAELSKTNSCDLTSKEMRKIIQFLLKTASSVKQESNNITNKNQIKESEEEFRRRMLKEFFHHKDSEGNNVLMILAKHTMDGALREILTNDNTMEHITHSVLLIRNNLDQTLMSIIEVNREDMSESLALILKAEYACHAGDLIQAEICLSGQMETSNSAFEIIKGLHQLQPMTWCQQFQIWLTLFLTWLIPNYFLTAFDWYSDGYLAHQYWNEWNNETVGNIYKCKNATDSLMKHWNEHDVWNKKPLCVTYNMTFQLEQSNLTCSNSTNYFDPSYDPCDPLKAYATCITGEVKFWYTLVPIMGPVMLYMIEFFVLTEDYEPTGLRKRIKDTWKNLMETPICSIASILIFFRMIILILLATLAIIFWMPVSAWCKFKADGQYETRTGIEKVALRRHKRCMDLAASRGELMEVSIEDVFEPMIQGYILFPSIISILQRFGNSIRTTQDGSIALNFELKTIEIGQMFSICISMVCLAWCYSEYNSVRKNMYLDISMSPFSRLLMWFYMLCQIMARLFAFMLFTLYWGPGNFYPLMIFILIHMIVAGFLHIVFSDDLAYVRKGKYLKFFHNVTFNSLASIYFHNYVQQDENVDVKTCKDVCVEDNIPGQQTSITKVEDNSNSKDNVLSSQETEKSTNNKIKSIKIHGSRLHTSTLLRQIMFDVLYMVEFGVLLGFGLHSKPFLDYHTSLYCSNFYIILAIIVLYIIALSLRMLYYTVMHVWSNVIWFSKKLQRKEMTTKDCDEVDQGAPEQFMILTQKKFIKYVFVCRNTWILGKIKHVEITLLVLPKWIIDNIKSSGERLVLVSQQMLDQFRVWFYSFTCACPDLLYKIVHIVMSVLIFTLLFLVLNVLVIGVMLVLLLLSFPVLVILFLINLGKGFVPTDEGNFQDVLEQPPDISQEALFAAYPKITLFSLQQSLENNDGLVNLKNRELITSPEFALLAHKLLAFDSQKYPLKTLDLTNCCVNNDEMIHLGPLMAKFEKVILNGTQNLDHKGWTILNKVIYRMSVIPNSVKLKVLELKIEKKKEDVMKEGRELFWGETGKQIMENLQPGQNIDFSTEEFDGLSMNGKSLKIIAEFLPKLEEVYLDNVFMEKAIFSRLKKKAEGTKQKLQTQLVKEYDKFKSENPEQSEVVDAWVTVRDKILEMPDYKRKLKCLSLNGCQINDFILQTLAPALVKINKLHLAENPEITEDGWKILGDRLTDNDELKVLSLKVSKPTSKHLIKKTDNMPQLAQVLSKMEEVDISGQKDITTQLFDDLEELSGRQGYNFKLKVITLSRVSHEKNLKTRIPSLKIKYLESDVLINMIRLVSTDSIAQCKNKPAEDMV